MRGMCFRLWRLWWGEVRTRRRRAGASPAAKRVVACHSARGTLRFAAYGAQPPSRVHHSFWLAEHRFRGGRAAGGRGLSELQAAGADFRAGVSDVVYAVLRAAVSDVRADAVQRVLDVQGAVSRAGGRVAARRCIGGAEAERA